MAFVQRMDAPHLGVLPRCFLGFPGQIWKFLYTTNRVEEPHFAPSPDGALLKQGLSQDQVRRCSKQWLKCDKDMQEIVRVFTLSALNSTSKWSILYVRVLRSNLVPSWGTLPFPCAQYSAINKYPSGCAILGQELTVSISPITLIKNLSLSDLLLLVWPPILHSLVAHTYQQNPGNVSSRDLFGKWAH